MPTGGTDMSLLGFDIGTTGVKGVLVSDSGNMLCETNANYSVSSPKPGWYEQDPEDWWQATLKVIQEIAKSSPQEIPLITGIGISGQYHGLVILDKDDKVIRPAILWNDQRTQQEADEIVDMVGEEKLLSISATKGAPYFTACKLRWVLNNEPHNYKKIKKMMLPKDYVRFKLTGEYVTDVSDASGTLFLDVKKRNWSKEITSILGVDFSILPHVVESSHISARVSKEAANLTGLKEGTPVAGGGGDQACAAIGNGLTKEGIVSYSIGTSGVIYGVTNSLIVDNLGRFDVFCHAIPDTWCVLACTNAAAASYDWFLKAMAQKEELDAKTNKMNAFAYLDNLAEQITPGSNKLLYLPYLSGERHPYTDTNARGVFLGIHTGHKKEHFIRAVLEGVAFSFRHCLDGIREHGIKIEEIRATGGGAKSDLWLNIQAHVSGQAIRRMDKDSGGAAFGAAILGGVCANNFSSVDQACEALVKPGNLVQLDLSLAKKYDKLFQIYKSLYPLLKSTYSDLAKLDLS